MAEGRGDRSGRRRHKSERQPNHHQTTATTPSNRRNNNNNNNKASSDSEIAQAGLGWSIRDKCHLFHEGVDVDQLARYRRRRIEVPRSKEQQLDIGITPREEENKQQAEKENVEEEEKKEDKREDKEDTLGRADLTEYRLAFRVASSDDIYRDCRVTTPRPKSQLDNSDDNILSDNLRASYNNILLTSSNDIVTNQSNEKTEEEKEEAICFAQKSQTQLDFERVAEMGSEIFRKQAPIRRPTTLQYEGDFSSSTEYSSIFVNHPGNHRSELRRRGTSLRMEGDFDGRTEKNDSYREWPINELYRPVAPAERRCERARSNLKLEGELEARTTECKQQYVPFVGVRRPELLKRSSQWRIEGDDCCWTPEYADVFRGYDFVDRPTRKLPIPNLRPDGGGFYDRTETKDFFVNPRDKELELMKAEEAEETERKRMEQEEEEEDEGANNKKKQPEDARQRRKEDEMRMLVSKLEDLKGPPLEVPEYKAAYKEFPRERAKLVKPGDEIGLSDGSKVPNSSHNRHFAKKIDQDPEYKSMYVGNKDYVGGATRGRTNALITSRRTSAASSSTPAVNNVGNNVPFGFHYRRARYGGGDQQPLTEIRSQYVDYGLVPRTESLRAPANLRLEGSHDMEPEYRTAFRDFRRRSSSSSNNNNDNHRQNSIQVAPAPPHHRRINNRDRSLSANRRNANGNNGNVNNNYWIDNDNGDRFGAVNAGDQQDAFQVLHTRLHEESVVGKPPPSNRRNSRLSLARGALDPERTTRVRNRSPSPVYSRLQQQPKQHQQQLPSSHIDEDDDLTLQSRANYRHRSRRPSPSLIVHPSNNRSPSPIIQQPTERAYSPSFAKEVSPLPRNQQQQHQQQAFVVLDSITNKDLDDVTSMARRRKAIVDRNYETIAANATIRPSNGVVTGINGNIGNSNGNVNNNNSSSSSNGRSVLPARSRSPSNWMPPWYDSSTSTI